MSRLLPIAVLMFATHPRLSCPGCLAQEVGILEPKLEPMAPMALLVANQRPLICFFCFIIQLAGCSGLP